MTTTTDRPAVTEAAALRRAAELLAADALVDLIIAVPTSISIAKWEIAKDGIHAQHHAWPKNSERVRANLRSLAALFALAYRERAIGLDQIRVSASGVFGAVRVEFWDFVPVPCHCTGPCSHGVVSL